MIKKICFVIMILLPTWKIRFEKMWFMKTISLQIKDFIEKFSHVLWVCLLPDEVTPEDGPNPTNEEVAENELKNTEDDLHHVHLWLTKNCREDGSKTWENNVQDETDQSHILLDFAHFHFVVVFCGLLWLIFNDNNINYLYTFGLTINDFFGFETSLLGLHN